ncbi:3-carboxymuconate cyclase-like protein [Paludibacter propionicigenes WB4]|uniref:3-carboxymuconate cyclase-like protein n=1 Tax=Paludibacter propionicigenes (strain DSM 17365 / JCM 13257 / WB4) TaxID=694427 RepID=E4T357_PALPW|nr:lactonase family protein [Paludibacter propionicigenes]ADQ79151.1 3-carboxymuconate cyclase-like protein [Paludibacter propionicigenes WB4]
MKRIDLLLIIALLQTLSVQSQSYHLLIGTYTNPDKSQGIYSYNINLKTCAFTQQSDAKGISNPSFLALTPDKKYVYSVSENGDASSANAFQFDSKTGKLTFLNTYLTKGADPCYIATTPDHVFTANYSGGSVSVFGRKADGSLTDALQIIQHVGKSVNAERQGEPHVHQIIVSPDKKYTLVNDLGTDKVTVYAYNPLAKTDILTPVDTLNVKPGSGPRHSVFTKDGKRLYLVHEIDGTVSVLGMKNGKLKLLQETTLDRKAGTVNGAADIHLSPDEKYLYATNRGSADDITCFAVAADGKLRFKQQIPTGGKMPRNFAITPDGQYVFVGHQTTDNIVIFKRNIQTGLLRNTRKQIKVGSPVCLLFY